MRIIAFIPLPYCEEGRYWQRDLGLAILALRQLGHDAWLCALGAENTLPDGNPVILTTLDKADNPGWWGELKADAIILNTWSAPRYDKIREAASLTGALTLEKLDTSGVRSPRTSYRDALIQNYGSGLDMGRSMPVAALHALITHNLFWAFPSLMDVRMARTMARMHVLLAESPLAAARIRRHIQRCGVACPDIRLVPHPVNSAAINYLNIPKQNRVVSVGRWQSYQKDLPFVLKIMERFLLNHSEWEFDLIGSGVPSKMLDRIQDTQVRVRIKIHGSLDHEELSLKYNTAKIYLMASRWESFCIAAAEALCCGCSVVGSNNIPTAGFFASMNSGTTASIRNIDHVNDALDAEVMQWENGGRNGRLISEHWSAVVGMDGVAQTLEQILKSKLDCRKSRI